MIAGIGSDLANIERIGRALEKFGDRFVGKTFSVAEQAEINRRKKLSEREYACAAAKRFARQGSLFQSFGNRISRRDFSEKY